MNEQQANSKKNIFIIAIIVLVVLGASIYWQRKGARGPELENVTEEEKLDLGNLSLSVEQETMRLAVYFGSSKFSGAVSTTADCKNVLVVERNVPKTTTVARAALLELFKGPTGAEKEEGYFTAIAPGVEIKSLVIENRTAKADFSEALEAGADSACKSLTIREQIARTLKQFPTVRDVVISINGKTEGILQPVN